MVITKKKSKKVSGKSVGKKRVIGKRTLKEKRGVYSKLSQKEQFKKYLEKIEDPKYDGIDASWDLPENATPLEKTKYELCEKMLVYQQDNNLTDEEIAEKIHLTTGETRDILYCHIDYFTLDRLITYATRLFKPLEIKMVIEPKKIRRVSYARAI
jgi:predicted XRE-type DNA-binding protein